MESDGTETHNLAQELTAKVSEIAKMYDDWAIANKVLTWDEIEPLYQAKWNKEVVR